MLNVLRHSTGLSATQVADESGLSVLTVNRAYKSLKNKGCITQENKTRRKWIILK